MGAIVTRVIDRATLAVALLLSSASAPACSFDGVGVGSNATEITGGPTSDAVTGGPGGVTSLATGPTTDETSSTSGVDPTGCVPVEWYADADGDGFGDPGAGLASCDEPPGHTADDSDCDDTNPAINPDAIEICDGLDNDCDEGVDEYSSQNASCNGCQMLPYQGRIYYFCEGDVPWNGARAKCVSVGADMAVVDVEGEHEFLVQNLAGQAGAWWLGANDNEQEGVFRWVSGQPVPIPDPRWGPGQPDNGGAQPVGPENCLALAGIGAPFVGYWHDKPCEGDFVSGGTKAVCEGAIP